MLRCQHASRSCCEGTWGCGTDILTSSSVEEVLKGLSMPKGRSIQSAQGSAVLADYSILPPDPCLMSSQRLPHLSRKSLGACAFALYRVVQPFNAASKYSTNEQVDVWLLGRLSYPAVTGCRRDHRLASGQCRKVPHRSEGSCDAGTGSSCSSFSWNQSSCWPAWAERAPARCKPVIQILATCNGWHPKCMPAIAYTWTGYALAEGPAGR